MNAAAAVSLGIATGALLLWPVGCWRRVFISDAFGHTPLRIQSYAGTLGVSRYQYPQTVPRRFRALLLPLDSDMLTSKALIDFGRLHLDSLDRERPNVGRYDSVWCPSWFAVVIFGVVPVLWLRSFRR